MKRLLLLLLTVSPLHAALEAHFVTTQGSIIVELQFLKAPQAVANFITMAQATRPHLNPASGAISYTPYYIGEKFFRVIDSPTFKIAQTGSGTGTNSGGPGFSFKDEFDPTLTHVPYVLSMANSGPNSNGTQIFLTGNTSIPSLNNVHTIFGLITDPASRTVIDAILAAGNDGTTITGLTFSATDVSALSFDEMAQNLPTISQPSGSLSVVPGTSATWNLADPGAAGNVLRAFRSTTLLSGSWTELPAARKIQGLDAPALTTSLLDAAVTPAAFYNLTLTQHPGAVTPFSLAGRTVTIPLPSSILTYAFNATGTAGTTTITPTIGAPIVGPFTIINPNFDVNSLSFIADTLALNPRYLFVKAGCDAATATTITGHHATTQSNGGGFSPFYSGSISISR